MDTIIKYLKNIGIFFLLTLLFSFFINIFNYYDLLSQNAYKIMLILFTSISIFFPSLILGKNSSKKGYLEGIKFGLVSIILMFLISYLAFDNTISLSSFLYYLILIITSSIGSMIGINIKKEKNNL